MRIRKEFYLLFAIIIMIAAMIIFRPKKIVKLESTKIDGLEITKSEVDKIDINWSGKETTHIEAPPYMFLIANGNLIKGADLKIIDGTSMLPLTKFAEIVGAEVIPSENNGDEFTLKNDDLSLTFRLNDQSVEVNNKPEFLDLVPTRDGKIEYVPLKTFFEVFGYSVNYSSGEKSMTNYPLIPNYQQISVSKYPSDVEAISSEEAIEILTSELKKAYKTNFDKKWKKPTEDEQPTGQPEDEMRFKIRDGFTIKAETDRYYIIPVVWDFLVDKYTGDVYMFYQGDVYQYKLFDTKEKGSLAFPG